MLSDPYKQEIGGYKKHIFCVNTLFYSFRK